MAKRGKCSRQREGCGSGRRERGWGALRQTGAGVQGPQSPGGSGYGVARATGEQLESEEKAQALSSQLSGPS